MESIIRAGSSNPNGLDEFLNALDKLKQAQTYFEKNNPQSIELENVVCNIKFPLDYFLRLLFFCTSI